MKARKGYLQGYNAQLAVTKEQIILATEVTQEANDPKQLDPMIEAAQENVRKVLPEASIGAVLADAGYPSERKGATYGAPEPEFFVAVAKDWKQRRALRESPPPRGRIPRGMSARDRMERKLLTKRVREMYRVRGQTVEPAFGQIKEARKCGRFMRRGKKANDSEWKLMAASHNSLKLWRSGKRKPKTMAGPRAQSWRKTLKSAA